MISRLRPLLLVVLCARPSAGLAQTIPPHWRVIESVEKGCQVAVPRDWMHDRAVPNRAASPDGRSHVAVHESTSGRTLAKVGAEAEQVMRPVRIFENTDQRLWYETSDRKNDTRWYVAVADGGKVCDAQIQYEGPRQEAIAKKIVATLGPAQ